MSRQVPTKKSVTVYVLGGGGVRVLTSYLFQLIFPFVLLPKLQNLKMGQSRITGLKCPLARQVGGSYNQEECV